MQIARVILPLALDAYSYGVPLDLVSKVRLGMRVGVSMRNQVLIGVILSLETWNDHSPERLSPLLFLLEDELPLIPLKQLQLWQWIASYYMCPLGLVMRYALPSSLLPELRTWVSLKHPIPAAKLNLEAHSIQLYLQQNPRVLYSEFLKKFPAAKYNPAFDELYRRGAIEIHKQIQAGYSPLYEPALELHANYRDVESAEILKNYPGKRNIYAVLQVFLKLYADNQHRAIPVRVLKAHLGKNIRVYTQKLLLDGILQSVQLVRPRWESSGEIKANSALPSSVPELAIKGKQSLLAMTASLKPRLIVCNYGVVDVLGLCYTMIQELLAQGRQVLCICAENDVPNQEQRAKLRAYYGARIMFYDQQNNAQLRHELWIYAASVESMLICANAQGLQLPLTNLGAILLVDEPAHIRRRSTLPYLNTRDLALYTAQLHKVPIWLFSSMPSADSMYQVALQNYHLCQLPSPPAPKQVTITHILSHSPASANCLSEPVLDAIKRAKTEQSGILLFQNRIGYAPYIICPSCNWIAKCQHCDAGLTYFKKKHELRCRYCAKQYQVYPHCPNCLSAELKERKFGTEKVELSLEKTFADYRILRVDKEVLQNKGNYQQALTMLAAETKVDILVGTMAILPLLRKYAVARVAVLDADALLQAFDFNFRHLEHGFRLLLQLKELLSRSEHPQPQLLLQQIHPWTPEQRQFLERSDFQGFIQHELQLRKQFNLPPVCKMIRVQFKHRQAEIALMLANSYAESLGKNFPEIEILGPSTPHVSKIRDEFIYMLHLKIPRSQFWHYQAKEQLKTIAHQVLQSHAPNRVQIQFFVDP